MPKIRDFRNAFSAGVINEEFLAAGSDELTREALVEGTNVFITNARGLIRRPGTNRILRTGANGRLHVMKMKDGTLRFLRFSDGDVRIYEEDGTIEQTVTAPWDADALFEMAIVRSRDSNVEGLYIAHNDFWPRVLKYDGSTWSLSNFAFRQDGNGRKAGLFARFTDDPITMTLSAYTGTATMTFSESWLEAGHVGATFVYMKNQVVVTTVNSATSATVSIVDRIYPTLRVNVTDETPFTLGEIVSGDVTAVSGQIVAIGSGYIDVVLDGGYTPFLAADGDVSGEKINGAFGFAEVTSVSTLGSPGATNIWFEDLVSTVRGYPGTCTVHRNRLVFANFPEQPNAICASALGAETDFDVGGGLDSDAIFYFMDESPEDRILHLVSGEQLVILTENATWYVPEGPTQPFVPDNIFFEHISPDGASKLPPLMTPEGIIFADEGDQIIVLAQNGNQNRAWSAGELSVLGSELIKSPKQMVYAPGIAGRKERALLIVNGDGTLAVFCNRRGAEQGGWVPWVRKSGDRFESLAEHAGRVFCIATVNGAGTRFLEEFDFDAVTDAELAYTDTGENDEVCHVIKSSQVMEQVTLDGSGALPDLGTLTVDKFGHDFALAVSPAPYVQTQAGRQRKRVAMAYADMVQTGTFRLEGRLCQQYLAITNMETPPAAVTKEWKGSSLGSGPNKTIRLEQREGEGAPFHLRSLTMEVIVR